MIVLACLGALLAVNCSIAVPETPRWVMFVNFDHERGRSVFRRLVAACDSLDLQRRHRVRLEFVGVDVEDRVALGRALDRGLERKPVAIVALSSPIVVEAARRTEATPIVFATHQDPVDLNLAVSLVQRPSNLAGISYHIGVKQKMLELLREIAPHSRRIGFVVDHDEVGKPHIQQFLEAAGHRHGVQWKVVPVSDVDYLDRDIREAGAVDAWFVTKVTALDEHRDRFVSLLAATNRPAIYPSHFDVLAGGPIAYEAVFDDAIGALARQLDRVLSGVTPADIPIERPKRFRLSINVEAARRAGMRLTPEFLARADRVQ